MELWRAPDSGGVPNQSAWIQVSQKTVSGTSDSGTLTDNPSPAGAYWYGLHVVDAAGNWADQGSLGPVQITVNESCAAACAGDGATDDTSCLQKLLKNSCSTVTLPAGKTYKITSTLSLPAGKTVLGSGSTIITHIDTNQLIYITGSNVTLRNIHLTYQPPALNINRGLIVDLGPSVKNITVDNCVLSGAYAIVGVQINNADIKNVHVTNSTFNDMYFGVLYNTTNMTTAQLQNTAMHLSGLTISGNKMYNLQGDGVSINSPIFNYYPHNSGIPGVAAHNITISNNEIYAPNSKVTNRGFCVSVAGAVDVTISGNSLLDCKWQGIHIEDRASSTTVSGNYIKGIIGNKPNDISGWSSGRSGIWIIDSRKVWILDNHIENTIDEGILSTYGTATTYNKEVGLAGNRIVNAGTYGIGIAGPPGVDINTYVGPISPYSGNTVSNSGIAPYIMYGAPAGVTVTGNSWQ